MYFITLYPTPILFTFTLVCLVHNILGTTTTSNKKSSILKIPQNKQKFLFFSLSGWPAPCEGGDRGHEEPVSSAHLSSLPSDRDLHPDLHDSGGKCTYSLCESEEWIFLKTALLCVSTVQAGSCSITSLLRTVCRRRRPACFSDRSCLPWPTSTARDTLTGTSNRWEQLRPAWDGVTGELRISCNFHLSTAGKPADRWRPEPEAHRLRTLCKTKGDSTHSLSHCDYVLYSIFLEITRICFWFLIFN